MNFSDNTEPHAETALNRADAGAVLAREAGVPFQPPLGQACGMDPIAEWLSLMEVKAKSSVYRSYMYADDLVEWLLTIGKCALTGTWRERSMLTSIV